MRGVSAAKPGDPRRLKPGSSAGSFPMPVPTAPSSPCSWHHRGRCGDHRGEPAAAAGHHRQRHPGAQHRLSAGNRRRGRRRSRWSMPDWSAAAGISARIGEGLIYDMRSKVFAARPADADRVLHPDPDRRAHHPAEQRRARRAAGVHRHAVDRRQRTSISVALVLGRRCSTCPGRSPLVALGRPARVHLPGDAWWPRRLQAITRRGVQAQRRDDHDDDRALQRRRCAARQAVRAASATEAAGVRQPGRDGYADIGVDAGDVSPGASSPRSRSSPSLATAIVYGLGGALVDPRPRPRHAWSRSTALPRRGSTAHSRRCRTCRST